MNQFICPLHFLQPTLQQGMKVQATANTFTAVSSPAQGHEKLQLKGRGERQLILQQENHRHEIK
ncbi:hypothetical protein E2C01_011845 [Portunus trituberculatus]|uniref:Uncharacterized protein n=1 Tax=Portunus trituberculatus TaxID=210409 RepID=A0A5B7DCY0_PORTR|nr:hypothetical protein [Portunus trituberculatus]